MISLSELRQVIAQAPERIGAFGVKNLWVFGSLARAEETVNDIDFLVEFESSPSLEQFMGLKFLLEDLVQAPVDLHSLGSCPERFMNRIKPDLKHVA